MKKIILILSAVTSFQTYANTSNIEFPYDLKGRRDCGMTVHDLSFEGFAEVEHAGALYADISVKQKPGLIFRVEFKNGRYKGINEELGLTLDIFPRRRLSKGKLPFYASSYWLKDSNRKDSAFCRGVGIKPRKPGKPRPPRKPPGRRK